MALTDKKGQLKNPIFIPELFINENNYDYDQLCEQIETPSGNEKFTEEDKKYWHSVRENMKHEVIEKSVYEQLVKFYKNSQT